MNYTLSTIIALFFTFFITISQIYSQTENSKKVLSSQVKNSIDKYINDAIDDHYFPGGQVVVGCSSGVLYSKSYGYLDYSKKSKVEDNTIYDLASCTKIFSTTLSVMTLLELGELTLTTTIADVLTEADSAKYGSVMVRDLLYHCSGFKPTVPIALSLVTSADEKIPLMARYKSEKNPYLFDTKTYICKELKYNEKYLDHKDDPQDIQVASNLYLSKDYEIKLDSLLTEAYNPARKGYCQYSDLNFYFLQKIIERVTGMGLNRYVSELYTSMELYDIGYKPKEWCDISRIAPTEFDALFRRDTLRGEVHDEFAAINGGVCGNAGLFSNALTLSKICQMFINGGETTNGISLIKPETIERFTLPKRYSSGALRGLGFDKLNPKTTPYSYESYGHSGYTGTFFWIDPKEDLYLIILTNRVHPTRANKKFGPKYRSGLWELIN